MDVLPIEGKIRVVELAEWAGVGLATLIKKLEKENIPILKLSTYHDGWIIDLRDLKKGDTNGIK